MSEQGRGIGAFLVRSRLVYLWAIAATAWLIHSLQYVFRHVGILADMPADRIPAMLARTVIDIAQPIATGALIVLPILAIGYGIWRRKGV